MKAVTDKYIIQTVSRALDLLELFQKSEAELGLTDLGSRMNLRKNNVFRLVATLKAKNYLELNHSTGKYRLGIMTRALGQVATRQIDFVSHARPFLADLKLQCRETAYFSALRDGYTHYYDGVESDFAVRVAHQVGSSRPLYNTAAGRVQLAFMDAQKQRALLSDPDMESPAESSAAALARVQTELDRVAQQGYAIDDQEHDAGVVEIAAPVFDSNGAIVGAISIVGPEMRFSGTRMEKELVPLVCLSASRLSAALGHVRNRDVPAGASLLPAKPAVKKRTGAAKSYAFGGLKACC